MFLKFINVFISIPEILDSFPNQNFVLKCKCEIFNYNIVAVTLGENFQLMKDSIWCQTPLDYFLYLLFDFGRITSKWTCRPDILIVDSVLVRVQCMSNPELELFTFCIYEYVCLALYFGGILIKLIFWVIAVLLNCQ